jgi:hypothetical protein
MTISPISILQGQRQQFTGTKTPTEQIKCYLEGMLFNTVIWKMMIKLVILTIWTRWRRFNLSKLMLKLKKFRKIVCFAVNDGIILIW